MDTGGLTVMSGAGAIAVTYIGNFYQSYNGLVDSGDGVELLLDVGLDRRVTSSAVVEISAGNGRWSRRQVSLLRHSPSPREIHNALEALRPHVDGLFFVVPRAGRALNEAALSDHRIAYAAVNDATVFFEGEWHRPEEGRPVTSAQRARTSWARLAMFRLFALGAGESLSQSEIARRIGVSHVAVGKQLPMPDRLVERGPGGWRAVDRAGCWDRFMSDYPGARGLTTHWAATGDLAAQLGRIERVLHAQAMTGWAVSGDFAADFYAPWRRPSRVIVYVTEQLPLEQQGFATVRSADATVELRIPVDRTVLAMAREWSSPQDGPLRRYVDPLIAAWDLGRSPGGDVESAVEQLRMRALRERLWV
jgi:hypothetical protein